MLKQRILTAVILIPLCVLLVLKLPQKAFCLVTAAVVLRGAWEWTLLMGLKNFPLCLFYVLGLLFVGAASLLLHLPVVLYTAVGWWVLATVLVVTYPRTQRLWGKSVIVQALMGIVVLIPCWLAINYIRELPYGSYKLLFLFVLIWGADSGAYFAGKQWGKTKLAPAVSPGKSWQGLGGALLTTLFIAVGGVVFFGAPESQWFALIVLSFITVLFSVLGDLFESMLKRNRGVKDSGQLLPGHGGLLDRIDSLTAAAPIFAFGIYALSKISH